MLARPEKAVAEVAQTWDDECLVVEAFVERGGEDLDLGMPLLEHLHTFGRGDDTHHPWVAAPRLLDQVERLRRRAAGGEHRIEKQRDLVLEVGQLLVVDARHRCVLVALQAYVTNAHVRQQLEGRAKDAQAGSEDGDRNHLTFYKRRRGFS